MQSLISQLKDGNCRNRYVIVLYVSQLAEAFKLLRSPDKTYIPI